MTTPTAPAVLSVSDLQDLAAYPPAGATGAAYISPRAAAVLDAVFGTEGEAREEAGRLLAVDVRTKPLGFGSRRFEKVTGVRFRGRNSRDRALGADFGKTGTVSVEKLRAKADEMLETIRVQKERADREAVATSEREATRRAGAAAVRAAGVPEYGGGYSGQASCSMRSTVGNNGQAGFRFEGLNRHHAEAIEALLARGARLTIDGFATPEEIAALAALTAIGNARATDAAAEAKAMMADPRG